MGSVVLVVVVAIGAYMWIRATRTRREHWLRRLNLPGVWVEQGENAATMEFSGSVAQGKFRVTSTSKDRRRREWQLVGSVLVMTFDDGSKERHDLTFYDSGKIGLERAPGQRIFLQKTPANVIPLHNRA